MKIALAADHGGYDLKEAILRHLQERSIETVDLGTDNAETSVDYPLFGEACARQVADGKADLGIVCCGTGIGISIAANKVPGIRCALPYNDFTAEMCKRHNNANMVAFGGRSLAEADVLRYVDIWLDTEYEGGRHDRRLNELAQIR